MFYNQEPNAKDTEICAILKDDFISVFTKENNEQDLMTVKSIELSGDLFSNHEAVYRYITQIQQNHLVKIKFTMNSKRTSQRLNPFLSVPAFTPFTHLNVGHFHLRRINRVI